MSFDSKFLVPNIYWKENLFAYVRTFFLMEFPSPRGTWRSPTFTVDIPRLLWSDSLEKMLTWRHHIVIGPIKHIRILSCISLVSSQECYTALSFRVQDFTSASYWGRSWACLCDWQILVLGDQLTFCGHGGWKRVKWYFTCYGFATLVIMIVTTKQIQQC